MVEIFIICGKHSHDHIISLRRVHIASLTPSFCIEVPVLDKESVWSCLSKRPNEVDNFAKIRVNVVLLIVVSQ